MFMNLYSATTEAPILYEQYEGSFITKAYNNPIFKSCFVCPFAKSNLTCRECCVWISNNIICVGQVKNRNWYSCGLSIAHSGVIHHISFDIMISADRINKDEVVVIDDEICCFYQEQCKLTGKYSCQGTINSSLISNVTRNGLGFHFILARQVVKSSVFLRRRLLSRDCDPRCPLANLLTNDLIDLH